MDANGLHFWMLTDRCDWDLGSNTAYDRSRRSLKLASLSQRNLGNSTASYSEANSQREILPRARDNYGTFAYWDVDRRQIMAAGAVPGEVPILTLPAEEWPSDLVMGFDGVLYIALTTGAVLLLDRRGRWDPHRLESPGFMPWRLAADPAGGVWALDKSQRKLARLQGLPFPRRPHVPRISVTAESCDENPNPPHLDVFEDAFCPNTEEPAGIACNFQGKLAALTWQEPSGESRLRLVDPQGNISKPLTLRGSQRAYSLAWVTDDQVALLVCHLVEAPVYKVVETAVTPDPRCEDSDLNSDIGDVIDPTGDYFPLPEYESGPFLHGLDLPPHFPRAASHPAEPDRSQPLHHLSLPSFANSGEAANNKNFPLDSGSSATVWHRLYIEADVPNGSGVQIYLAASNDPAPPTSPTEWHLHCLGKAAQPASPTSGQAPLAAWVPFSSEVPYSPSLLQCPLQKDQTGLFTLLIQRSGRPVRDLRGRYLHLKLRLVGDGLSSPEVAAVRAYASRFSYRDHYLPALYHETTFGPDADVILPDEQVNRSTPSDFLERFLDNFEGILTPLEERIADSYLVTDPRTAPTEALDWLGSWIGLTFDRWYPEAQRRNTLRWAHELYRWHGTLKGLQRSLDVATNGGVSGGEIIVIENYRLRRTFVTILGADLAEENDPLLNGLSVSGNSYVGDTLFLGDEHRKEFLAIFDADLSVTASEERAIESLFDRLAYRVTVLVHQEVEPQDLAIIRRIVDLETPAHVEATVQTASYGFLVGVASLIGIDTYLGSKPRPGPVKVNHSQIGMRDLLQHPASLDPRLEAGTYGLPPEATRPIAIGKVISTSGDFELSASGSRAFPGRRITRYVWEIDEQEP